MTESPEPRAPRLALSLADFELLRRIGDGSYSHVVLARHKESGKEYALKVVDKQYIIRHKVVEHIKRERHILDSLAYPGIVQLFFTFQDAFSLYLGLEHCPNGELYDQIRLRGRLDEAAAQFYAAEVVLMLAHLREHAVVHRDLKPENLLLDAEGHLKLIDFGSAKRLSAAEVAPQAAAAAAAAEQAEAAREAQGSRPAAAAAGEAQSSTSAAEAAGAAAEAAAPGAAAAPATQSAGAAGQGEPAAGGPGPQHDGQQGADEPPDNGGSSGGNGSSSGGEQGQPAAPSDKDGSKEASQSDGGSEAEPSGRLGAESKRAVSLVGTADYVSPEVLSNGCLTCAADLWALGCVLYQMLVGRPPFKSLSEHLTFQKTVDAEYEVHWAILLSSQTNAEYLTFQKIVDAEYELPEGLSEPAADLIRRLLQVDPVQRMGATDLGELKAHPFFAGVDWATLRSQPAPEFVPNPELDPALSSANSSFDWELQSLASMLPHVSSADDTLALE